jgi:hypothetical protein
MTENNVKNGQSAIESIIRDANLSGETLENANNFARFLEENEMTAGGEHGAINYKDKCVCYMHLNGADERPGPWTIWTDGDYSSEREDVPMNDHEKDIAWANVNYCASCGGSCSPGINKVIFGKAFENVCSADMAFYVPNAETLECVKKLLIIKKLEISEEYGING